MTDSKASTVPKSMITPIWNTIGTNDATMWLAQLFETISNEELEESIYNATCLLKEETALMVREHRQIFIKTLGPRKSPALKVSNDWHDDFIKIWTPSDRRATPRLSEELKKLSEECIAAVGNKPRPDPRDPLAKDMLKGVEDALLDQIKPAFDYMGLQQYKDGIFDIFNLAIYERQMVRDFAAGFRKTKDDGAYTELGTIPPVDSFKIIHSPRDLEAVKGRRWEDALTIKHKVVINLTISDTSARVGWLR